MSEATSELRRAGGLVIKEVRERLDHYLSLAAATNEEAATPHLSEYVGLQMLGAFSRYALDRYFSGLASGRISAGHGYDEDPISQEVVGEVAKLTGTKRAVIVPTGTAANLDLISSFVVSRGGPGSLKFLACESEHTVALEGGVLQKAGVRKEDLVLLPSRRNDGIVNLDDLKKAVATLDGGFIFQMALPSNEGVTPSLEEIKKLLAAVKEKKGLFLVDGARLPNALAYLKADLNLLTEIGVDGFTLGTSKKGGLAEMVCIADEAAAKQLPIEAKSFGHISSKGSPLALVSGLFLTTTLWKREAQSENDAAARFAKIISEIGINPEFPPGGNSVFLKLQKGEIEELKKTPSFGAVYDDYGPNRIARVVFLGFQPPEVVLSAAAALAEAREVSGNRFLSVLTEEERELINTKKIETDYLGE